MVVLISVSALRSVLSIGEWFSQYAAGDNTTYGVKNITEFMILFAGMVNFHYLCGNIYFIYEYMKMKSFGATATATLALIMISASCTKVNGESTVQAAEDNQNAVIETIMSRRSVRAYEERAIPRDTMDIITECGINAPNGMNKQEWEIRVVDNPEFINGVTELFVKENPEAAKDPGFKNIFRNAPTVVFIGAPESTYSGVNCGLLGENMILAAWSMGIGSCCLGGPVRFMNSEVAAEYLKQLKFSEGYSLIYAIGFGYPAENPEAKPRDKGKIMYIN